MTLRNLLKLEEFAMLVLGMVAFSFLPYAWWWFLVLFLAPDIGMIGYIFGDKSGAATYNLMHHKGLAIGIALGGILLVNPILQLIGIILFSHACFDRMLGYGLKYDRGFKYTHLGKIAGPKEKAAP